MVSESECNIRHEIRLSYQRVSLQGYIHADTINPLGVKREVSLIMLMGEEESSFIFLKARQDQGFPGH